MSEPVTVSELNRHVRSILERSIPLTIVLGEISNLVRAASGHFYFTLKDEAAQVRCVMFRSRAQLLPWKLENGQQVEAHALVTLYEARGDFQLNIEMLRRSGLGRLFEAFARLREKLEREGLFEAQRKRPLPRFPRAIAVVTSLQAAALRDVLAALRRRAPHVEILVYPTPVQGDGAAEQIAYALKQADENGICDVTLLVRGGGSIEDLWSFNEEIVARSIVASTTPVVCGVGHETDVTIADFAADQRAATPTAAAELASAGWFAAAREIRELDETLRKRMHGTLEQRMQRLDLLARRLLHPGERLARHRQQLAHLQSRLGAAAHRQTTERDRRISGLRLRLAHARPDSTRIHSRLRLAAQALQGAGRKLLDMRAHSLGRIEAALTALNPNATLARGYSIARDAEGRVVSDSRQLDVGAAVQLQFARGTAEATIDKTGE